MARRRSELYDFLTSNRKYKQRLKVTADEPKVMELIDINFIIIVDNFDKWRMIQQMKESPNYVDIQHS